MLKTSLFPNSMARTTLFPIHKRQMLGAGIGLCIFLLGMFVINNISGAKKNLIADAFLIDITITFPLIWYFMVIRPLKFKTWNLMLVFTICCIAAFIISSARTSVRSPILYQTNSPADIFHRIGCFCLPPDKSQENKSGISKDAKINP